MSISDQAPGSSALIEARKLEAAYAPYGTVAERLIPGVCKHARTRCTHGYEQLRVGLVRCLMCGRGVKQPPSAVCWWTGEPHLTAAPAPPTVRHPRLSVRLNRWTRWLR